VTAAKAALIGVRSGARYPIASLDEFGSAGESLEVRPLESQLRQRREGDTIYERFRDFWFLKVDPQSCSLGEGHTPLIKAPPALKAYTGLDRLYLKNETANPTWSFKDRGTVACCALARELSEGCLATVSTGNMGQSVAAYGARCGLRSVVIVPATAAPEKIAAAALYGATVLRVNTDDLCALKARVKALAHALGVRITSGANPVRLEGYKFETFELWEQMEGIVPDFVAVPTSAGGHLRGLFKGWKELEEATLIETLPRMIIVQPAVNAPLADALALDSEEPLPSAPVHTLASALTSNDPPGGRDILEIARREDWCGATATEDEIREGWHAAARAGLWIEPSSAIVFPALRGLVRRKALSKDALVVAVLTGAGPKDPHLVTETVPPVDTIGPEQLDVALAEILSAGQG